MYKPHYEIYLEGGVSPEASSRLLASDWLEVDGFPFLKLITGEVGEFFLDLEYQDVSF